MPGTARTHSHDENDSIVPYTRIRKNAHTRTQSKFSKAAGGRSLGKYAWAHHISTIKQLYLNENKILREVMEIIDSEYNIHATYILPS